MSDGTATCVDLVLAVILPPLGVFLKYGCPLELWICVLLTFRHRVRDMGHDRNTMKDLSSFNILSWMDFMK